MLGGGHARYDDSRGRGMLSPHRQLHLHGASLNLRKGCSSITLPKTKICQKKTNVKMSSFKNSCLNPVRGILEHLLGILGDLVFVRKVLVYLCVEQFTLHKANKQRTNLYYVYPHVHA